MAKAYAVKLKVVVTMEIVVPAVPGAKGEDAKAHAEDVAGDTATQICSLQAPAPGSSRLIPPFLRAHSIEEINIDSVTPNNGR